MSHDDKDGAPARVRWARLRFSIIGHLLASPPEPGEVGARIAELASRPWRHPTTGEEFHLSAKTIERMYYAARDKADPIRALERKPPAHAGKHPSVSPELGLAIETQYREHPGWSYQLHYDNLLVVARDMPASASLPAYATVRRFMKDHGLFRTKRRRHGKGGEDDPMPRETRSYEVAHVNALWHYDFHEGRRKVLTASGEWKTPSLFGLLDDCSRVCCHAQWYLEPENTETLIHGLSQGIQKRQVPRATLSDRGGAMMAAETVEGHERLSIVHHLTGNSARLQRGTALGRRTRRERDRFTRSGDKRRESCRKEVDKAVRS
jgi:putative transposase